MTTVLLLLEGCLLVTMLFVYLLAFLHVCVCMCSCLFWHANEDEKYRKRTAECDMEKARASIVLFWSDRWADGMSTCVLQARRGIQVQTWSSLTEMPDSSSSRINDRHQHVSLRHMFEAV